MTRCCGNCNKCTLSKCPIEEKPLTLDEYILSNQLDEIASRKEIEIEMQPYVRNREHKEEYERKRNQAYDHKRYWSNPEKHRKQALERYYNKREENLARQKEYYKKNAEEIRLRQKKRYADNKEEINRKRREQYALRKLMKAQCNG